MLRSSPRYRPVHVAPLPALWASNGSSELRSFAGAPTVMPASVAVEARLTASGGVLSLCAFRKLRVLVCDNPHKDTNKLTYVFNANTVAQGQCL